MKASFAAVCGVLLLTAAVQAAEPVPALPPGVPRQIADIASYGTLTAGLGLEVAEALHCPDRTGCLERVGFKVLATFATTFTLQQAFPRLRPCAPDCGIDNPHRSLPSMHAALAGQTVDGDHKVLKAILSGATVTLRPLANKHHVSDVVLGWTIGKSWTYVW